jgi:hypothetical protein
MKMFGVLDLDTGMHGCRFSIGVRNAHDKSMRLAMTVPLFDLASSEKSVGVRRDEPAWS